MKQILQSLSSGEIFVEDIPVPQAKSGELLLQSRCTLISAGTERMLLDFGKAGIIGKIKQQPDKVKQIIDKIKTDGLLTTLEAVKAKLDQPIPLGYCNVGQVLDVGGVEGFKVGDRVLSNGFHAEIVRVPKNLCVKIPENVSDQQAVFAVLGAIALQGIRLLNPTLAECIVVQGLGLIGLMAIQLLIANGCRVLGVDFDQKKCELAKSFGAEVVNLGANEDLISKAELFSRGRGVDGVLITASASTDEIVHQAAIISRQRGRIILVGVVGLNLRRDDFYKKELSFQVSCSYGPGRYDKSYEEQGHDYPCSYVRWTEQRNFEAVLDMMASGKLNVIPLVSQQFCINDAIQAYAALEEHSNLGIILNYLSGKNDSQPVREVKLARFQAINRDYSRPVVAFVGAGNYANRMLMPAFKASGVVLDTVITNQGVSGVIHGKRHGFNKTGTDFQALLENDNVNVVVIATQHNLHAQQVIDGLNAHKNVFVEKPLALTIDELKKIEEAYHLNNKLLMVGFNRRFAPHVKTAKRLLSAVSLPKAFIMTINAGHIPSDHWTQKQEVGGGRIIGEACHFIDLLRFLAGSQITSYYAVSQGGKSVAKDVAMITLAFEDGSCGTIQYLANGHKKFPKERLEIFCQGKILQLDNFIKMRGFGWSNFKKQNLWKQDKGQRACVQAFIDVLKQGQESPISFKELIEVSQISIDIADQLRKQNENGSCPY